MNFTPTEVANTGDFDLVLAFGDAAADDTDRVAALARQREFDGRAVEQFMLQLHRLGVVVDQGGDQDLVRLQRVQVMLECRAGEHAHFENRLFGGLGLALGWFAGVGGLDHAGGDCHGEVFDYFHFGIFFFYVRQRRWCHWTVARTAVDGC